MVAMQIARDPLVRQCVRQTFYERAKLKIKPTKKGKKVNTELVSRIFLGCMATSVQNFILNFMWKYCYTDFIWIVSPQDFIHRLKSYGTTIPAFSGSISNDMLWSIFRNNFWKHFNSNFIKELHYIFTASLRQVIDTNRPSLRKIFFTCTWLQLISITPKLYSLNVNWQLQFMSLAIPITESSHTLMAVGCPGYSGASTVVSWPPDGLVKTPVTKPLHPSRWVSQWRET